MNWMDAADTALSSVQTDTGITFDLERNDSPADQLPDSYIAYFQVDDNGKGYADGKETSHEPRIQVSFFYRDKPDAKTIPDKIEKAMAVAGFTLGPAGRIPYQTDTGHYGWRRDFYYYERR